MSEGSDATPTSPALSAEDKIKHAIGSQFCDLILQQERIVQLKARLAQTEAEVARLHAKIAELTEALEQNGSRGAS